jgi:hypothetical protein
LCSESDILADMFCVQVHRWVVLQGRIAVDAVVGRTRASPSCAKEINILCISVLCEGASVVLQGRAYHMWMTYCK